MLAEADLVAQALMGRAAAFREIMRRNNRRLFRTARSVLRDDAEAEDAVQESYVRAFRSLADFRGHASLSTWLTRITLNEALGRLRRRRNTISQESAKIAQSGVGANILMFPTGQAGGDPENTSACREIRRILEEAIDGLPEAFRVVLVARDVDGMSIGETAQVLGVRSETVRTRLHRARYLLRQVLERRLGDTLQGAFPFDGARCARLSDAVLSRLGLPTPGPPE
ncbi:MAG TPA: RNA polymerase sigma factor [Roseomonas sp.]|jgi:RNA polymerase sigma-70 factor (ECF subfamily)